MALIGTKRADKGKKHIVSYHQTTQQKSNLIYPAHVRFLSLCNEGGNQPQITMCVCVGGNVQCLEKIRTHE
jgi:hypothetical protein